MASFFRLAYGILCLILVPSVASSAVFFRIDPNPVRVTEGTNEASFLITMESTDGETFNSATLSFGIGDGGDPVGQPQDGDNLRITSFNLGSIFDSTDFTASISSGGLNESAILVDFARASGNANNIDANGVLASFSVDTSQTSAGQSFVLDNNLLGFSEVSQAVGENQVSLDLQAIPGTLEVTAIPEPSTLMAMLIMGLITAPVIRRRMTAVRSHC